MQPATAQLALHLARTGMQRERHTQQPKDCARLDLLDDGVQVLQGAGHAVNAGLEGRLQVRQLRRGALLNGLHLRVEVSLDLLVGLRAALDLRLERFLQLGQRLAQHLEAGGVRGAARLRGRAGSRRRMSVAPRIQKWRGIY